MPTATMSNVPSSCGSTSVSLTRQPTRNSDWRAVLADLVALADADRPEQPLGRVRDPEQVVHQRAVAVLEHLERHADSREQHRVQREHRQRVAHTSDSRPPTRRPTGDGAAAPERGRQTRIGTMIRRIDLRGAARARRLPRGGAARGVRRRGRAPGRPADLRRRPRPGRRGDHRVLPTVRRRRPDRHRRTAARPSTPRSRRSTPPCGPGWRSRSAGSAPPARPSSSTTSSPSSGRAPRVTHRMVPVDRVGPLRPRRDRAAGLQRRHERRARPGRRRLARSR